MAKAKTLRDRAAAAQPAARHVTICWRGDLYADIQRLDEELRAILNQAGGDGRLSGNAEANACAAKIEAAQAEMRENTDDFVMGALEPGQWTQLKAAHPPRKDNAADERQGVNIDAFSDALFPRCIAKPDVDADLWEFLLPKLSPRQYDELVSAAWAANEGDTNVPLSPAVLRMRTSASESRRQNDSASPSDDSTDGNPGE